MTTKVEQVWQIPVWVKWVFGPTVFLALALLTVSFFWDDFQSWERRFPFPADQPLTEQVAIDYSRRAFALTRIEMTGATPVPFYNDRTNIFFFNSMNTNSGSLQWRVPSEGTERGASGNFTASVQLIGKELVVKLSKHWL